MLVTVEVVEGLDLVVTSFEGCRWRNGFRCDCGKQGGGDAGAFTIGLYTQLTGEPTEEDTPDDNSRIRRTAAELPDL